MGRKNLDRYTEDDWRHAAWSVEAILINRWPVFADCPVCDLRIRADVRRIAEVKGPRYSLWGTDAPCRRVGCPGRVSFSIRPRGAISEIVMTAKR